MTCIRCKHDTAYKFGTYGKRNIQRYRCRSCKATFADAPPKTLGTHYTDIDRASKVFSLMLEGMSIRAISRITDMDKNTMLREPLDDWDEPDWGESALCEMGCIDEDEDDDPAILEYMNDYEAAYLQEKEDRLIRKYSGDVFIRVGKRVRELRKAKGLTQHDLALHVRLGRTYTSNVERGAKNPSLRSLKIFALGFEMTLSQFLAAI